MNVPILTNKYKCLINSTGFIEFKKEVMLLHPVFQFEFHILYINIFKLQFLSELIGGPYSCIKKSIFGIGSLTTA